MRCSFLWDMTDILGTPSKNLKILEVYFIASINALHPFLHVRWEKNSAYFKNIGYWVWEDSAVEKKWCKSEQIWHEGTEFLQSIPRIINTTEFYIRNSSVIWCEEKFSIHTLTN